MKAWATIQVVMPTATRREKVSGAPLAILYPLKPKSKKVKTTIEERISPNSSAITANIESVADSGK